MKGDCACMDNEDEDGDEEGQEAEQDELIYEVSWLCFFFGTSRWGADIIIHLPTMH